jgi:hypothetical protein
LYGREPTFKLTLEFADRAAKPVNERAGACPWATYHIEVAEWRL